MDDAQRLAWLSFTQLSGIKRQDRRLLLEQYGSASQALASAPWGIQPSRIRWPDENKLKQQLELIHQHHMHLIPWGDVNYPSHLATLIGAPLLLFVQGELSLLSRPQIAMVGSRSASPGGIKTATSFAHELSGSGITVTSGLALGIDGACHQGALKGISSTIAVVATGLDQVYPRRHTALAEQIREQGALISEFAPLSSPRRESFPQRNRIISGLSLGVLVVEAGIRSGSLITARLAGEQGREIFAIPGSIHLPTSRGCHQLIRQGAKLVETIADVLVEVKHSIRLPETPKPSQQQPLPFHATSNNTANNAGSLSPKATTDADNSSLDPQSKQVLALLDYAPISLETLIEQSQLPIEQISTILLQLELLGLIAPSAGGQYQKI